MNAAQIAATVLQVLLLRSVSFAATVGKQHLLVSISEGSSVNAFSGLLSLLQVVGSVLAGQPGSFTFGVFSVSIQDLSTTPRHADSRLCMISEAGVFASGDQGTVTIQRATDDMLEIAFTDASQSEDAMMLPEGLLRAALELLPSPHGG